jgi:hypothetical protein
VSARSRVILSIVHVILYCINSLLFLIFPWASPSARSDTYTHLSLIVFLIDCKGMYVHEEVWPSLSQIFGKSSFYVRILPSESMRSVPKKSVLHSPTAGGSLFTQKSLDDDDISEARKSFVVDFLFARSRVVLCIRPSISNPIQRLRRSEIRSMYLDFHAVNSKRN